MDMDRLISLQTYLILNQSAASRYQLSHFLQRSGWAKLGRVGAYTEETLSFIESGNHTPIFLRLADPEEPIPISFVYALRKHPAVIITSPYPQHLFCSLELKPFDYLTEPYSFERFSACISRYSSFFNS